MIMASVTPQGDVHNFKAKLDKEACVPCRACEMACPDDALKLAPGGRVVDYSYDRCRGCDRCVEVCPQAILQITERYNSRGDAIAGCTDEDRCTACWECARACPVHAIRIWCFSITAGG